MTQRKLSGSSRVKSRDFIQTEVEALFFLTDMFYPRVVSNGLLFYILDFRFT